jgi:hypothetical protein
MVGQLTISEVEVLSGKTYSDGCYYNPIQDKNNNWIISTEEIDKTTDPEFLWIKSISLIPFEGKVWNFPLND